MTPREAAVVTAYTGIFLGDFPTYHNYVEEVMGRPVWTHEMADGRVAQQIKQASKADFMAIEVPVAFDVDVACEVMHDAYEQAAAEVGWQTQAASRKPWAEVPEANKVAMRAAVRALFDWQSA